LGDDGGCDDQSWLAGRGDRSRWGSCCQPGGAGRAPVGGIIRVDSASIVSHGLPSG
jgi:hypothetical protein